jgi:outer membrane protein OmpA-like peptidoglycan-associated protein
VASSNDPGNSAVEVALAWRVNRKKQADRRHPRPETIISEPGEEAPARDQATEKAPDRPAAAPPPATVGTGATPSRETPPPALPPTPAERREERLARHIAYPLGSTGLPATDEQLLDSLARELKAHPEWQLRISGHTCSLGSPETNEKVSLERARLVQQRLVQKGVPASQLRATGQADRYPIAPNDTEAGRARNRRVEFVIVG